MNDLIEIIEKRFKLYLSIVFVLSIVLAWANRFIQDDAFISFRYAKNLVKGWGLVFNKGERVEGYTNFLWTIIISFPIKFGLDPIVFSYTAGIFFFIITLYFTFKLSVLIFNSKVLSLLTIFLLGTNYTMSCYATGGLETQMQTAIVAASFFLCLKYFTVSSRKNINLFLLSILLGISVLTRPDSFLFLTIILSVLIFFQKDESLSKSTKLIRLLNLTVPAVLIIAAYTVWKINYYGEILPNTYYVKASSQTSIISGLLYAGWFLKSYWLFPFLLILLISIKDFLNKTNFKINVLLITIFIWALYIIKVGGDFMEFRFFVPVLPFILIVIVWIINKLVQPEKLKIVFVIIVLLGSLYHSITFHYHSGIEDINLLESHLTSPDENWIGIGKKLNEMFGKSDVKIAVTAAGAIPYYSELKTLDMLGLNDKYIGREKHVVSNRPGHQKLAPLDYLQKRGVNILIGHPFVMKESFKISEISNKMFEDHFQYSIKDLVNYNPKILIEQLDTDHILIMIYLNESKFIEDAINEMKIQAVPFSEIADNG